MIMPASSLVALNTHSSVGCPHGHVAGTGTIRAREAQRKHVVVLLTALSTVPRIPQEDRP